MRIAIIGAQGVGKTTVFNNFLARWSMYTTPEKTYRDLIKEKNLKLNENGDMASQMIIRDVLADIAMDNAGKQYTVHDRCPIDNLVYTLWLADKGKLEGKDVDEFIATSILMVKETMKFYDIIFWIPINHNIPLVNAENRSADANYRQEIDNIFAGVYEHYKTNSGLLFDKEDQPTMIPLDGELTQRMESIAQYIGLDGNLVENEGSAILDLQSAYEEEQLRRQVR
jgi:hypothetical protein